MLPNIPVKITATTVIGTTPPFPSEILTAIGVVTDFGTNDTVILCSRPNNLHIPYTLNIDAAEPTTHPTRIGSQYFFRISSFE